MDERLKFLVTSTQRCGSTWMADICRAVSDQAREIVYISGLEFKLMEFEEWEVNPSRKVDAFSKALKAPKHRGNLVFKTHDLPPALIAEFLDQNRNYIVVNVIRDFRDVLISRVMYNRYHLPAVGLPFESEFIKNRPKLSDEDLIRQFFGSMEMQQWLLDWKIFSASFEHERYVCFRYESLLTVSGLREAISALYQLHYSSEPPETDRVAAIAAETAFRNSATKKGAGGPRNEVKGHFRRKGIAGDHKRYLTKRQSEFLRIMMGDY